MSKTLDVVVIGGGFSGCLLALKLAAARPDARLQVVERSGRLGRGLAYGAAGPEHLLNVPVRRMDVGLQPSFLDWLRAHHGGQWTDADFAPRRLFGDYMHQQVEKAVAAGRIEAVTGEAVSLRDGDRRAVALADGRVLAGDVVVLAMGNLAPDAPGGLDRSIVDSPVFVADPWAPGALDGLAKDAPVLLVGAGLTMIDVALSLRGKGVTGPMTAVSRRGLRPQGHVAPGKGGGEWPPFLHGHAGQGPLQLARLMRRQIKAAQAAGAPWQAVLDAARPAVQAVWSAWSDDQRRVFLRRLRPWWDVHRHRTAPQITAAVDDLIAQGALRILGGRFGAPTWTNEGVSIPVHVKGGGEVIVPAARVINCTGPGGRFDRTDIALIADLRGQGLARPDPMGLGFETTGGAVKNAAGAASSWLFALGPLTKHAGWEITAVPEIRAQIDQLTARLAASPAVADL